MRLLDKVAIVTGAGRGIGQAIALGFAREGAHVAAADVDRGGAERTSETIRALGRRALTITVDVSSRDQVEAMVKRCVDELGGVNILVSNAGISHLDDFLELTDEIWDRVMAVNLKGTFLCGQVAARHMVHIGGGAIINLASQLAETANFRQAAYVTSKGAIKTLTKAMAVDLAPYGIRVNAIGPGPIPTDFNRERMSVPSYRERMLRRVPLGRFGEPQDIVGAAVFLAGDEAQWVTGHCLFVDGGWLAG